MCNTLKMLDTNVPNGVAIDIADDILLVTWMKVYPERFNQSKSLLHTVDST